MMNWDRHHIEKWRKVGPLRFPTLSPFSGVFSLKNGPQSHFRGSGEHRNFSDFCLDTPSTKSLKTPLKHY